MNEVIRLFITSSCLLFLISICFPSRGMGQLSLQLVEKNIALFHPVPTIEFETLHQLLKSENASTILLFDTRTQAEFERSHIASSIQLDPDMDAGTFFKKYGNLIAGKQLIFYCSVGYRSSIMVERLEQRVRQSGAATVANLRGGIFRWYNEGKSVVNQQGLTDEIHSYNGVWSALIKPRVVSP